MKANVGYLRGKVCPPGAVGFGLWLGDSHSQNFDYQQKPGVYLLREGSNTCLVGLDSVEEAEVHRAALGPEWHVTITR